MQHCQGENEKTQVLYLQRRTKVLTLCILHINEEPTDMHYHKQKTKEESETNAPHR